MKATEVRIRTALEPGDSYVDPTFVLVETTLGEDGEAATTIEHLANVVIDGRSRWQITTLGQSVPLSHAAALEWAVSFAASRNVPIVYHRDEASPHYAAAPSSLPEASSASK